MSHDFETDWRAVRSERHLPKAESPYRIAGSAPTSPFRLKLPIGSFSVAVWFKATAAPHPLMRVGDLFDLQLTPSGCLYFQPLRYPGLSALADGRPQTDYVDGDWHQVLVSFDPEAKRIIFAVDTVYWTTSPWPVLGEIGRASPSTLSMGDVSIFDEVLDYEGIKHVYNEGAESKGLPSRVLYLRAS